jgi:hypothetical protein
MYYYSHMPQQRTVLIWGIAILLIIVAAVSAGFIFIKKDNMAVPPAGTSVVATLTTSSVSSLESLAPASTASSAATSTVSRTVVAAPRAKAPALPPLTIVPPTPAAPSVPAMPVAASTVAPVIVSSTPPAPAMPERQISPQSIVGIICYYRYNNQLYPTKGSGVIVSPDGTVLTARHLVDPQWAAWAYSDTLSSDQEAFFAGSTVDHCLVGLPEGNTLPTAEEIQSLNPSLLITHTFQYVAAPAFIPRNVPGESDNESRGLDFALLRITGPSPDCATVQQSCNQLGYFPYTPLLYQETPPTHAGQVFTFGYPAEAINDADEGFYDFYLKGAVGQVQDFFQGDAALRGTPLDFSFMANDLQTGRSGSPIFYKGYVIGILYGNLSTLESFNVSAQAIHAVLQQNGQAGLVAYQ